MSTSILILLLMLSAPAAPGVPTSAPALNTPDECLEAMGKPDYALRQRATNALLRNEKLTLEDAARLYLAARLPEQRQRLLYVARNLLVRKVQIDRSQMGGQGCLGIRMPYATPAKHLAETDRAAVRVVGICTGFPAVGLLEPDDLILAIDGTPLPRDADPATIREKFSETIQSKLAGSVVNLRVQRGSEFLDVNVRLASLPALRELYPMPDRDDLVPQQVAVLWSDFLTRTVGAVPKLEPLRVSLPGRPLPDANGGNAGAAANEGKDARELVKPPPHNNPFLQLDADE